jgi:hypothetical protein
VAGEGRTETSYWVGTSLVAFGVLLPIVGFMIYSAACLEPCGMGGPGTCMFNRVTCDLNPIAGFLFTSGVAIAFIAFGMHLRETGSGTTAQIAADGSGMANGRGTLTRLTDPSLPGSEPLFLPVRCQGVLSNSTLLRSIADLIPWNGTSPTPMVVAWL